MIKTPQPNIAKKQEIIKSESPKIIAGKKNLEKGKWKPGQSGNSKGRKPKTFAGLAKQWQKEGYKRVTKEEIREAYEILLGADREKLLKTVNDEKQPMTIRIVAKRMLSGEGHEQIDSMLDRVHGRATENIKGEMTIGLADFLRGGK